MQWLLLLASSWLVSAAPTPTSTSSAATDVGILPIGTGHYNGVLGSFVLDSPVASSTVPALPSGVTLEGNGSDSNAALEFGLINATFAYNDSDVLNIAYTTDNDVALAALAGSAPNNTANATLNDLANQGRGLLGSEYTWQPNDATKAGNYTIINCNAHDYDPSSYASQLLNLIPQIQKNLIPTLYEIKHSNTASPYGFTALFKSSRYKKYLLRAYEKILTGAYVKYIPAGLPGLDKLPDDPQPAEIYCLRGDLADPISREAYSICVQRPRLVAFWAPGSPAIGLCPLFWQLPPAATSDKCPTFRGSQVVTNAGDELQLSQQAVLVHELSHLYIGLESSKDDVYSLAESMGLSRARQQRNPSNYAYFYSSMVAKCTGWPNSLANDGGL